mgnify:CR=1 FL=1
MSMEKAMPVSKQAGFALLAGIAALVVLVSAAIFAGLGGRKDDVEAAAPGPRTDDRAPARTWVGTWAAPATAAEPGRPTGYPDTSIRNVVRTTVGGTAARVHFSNVFGTRPLLISQATLAIAAAPSEPTAVPGTMRRLTFQDRPSVTVPAGATVTSDAVQLQVPSAADLLVTLYTPQPSGTVTYHPHARQTSYLAAGEHTAEPEGTAYTQRTRQWRYLSAVDVWTSETQGAVVVLGDSITAGITSSLGANHRWTDFLAERLRTERGAPPYSVLNQGISGNRILTDAGADPRNGPSGLHRVERDALSRTGVTTLVVQLGINDIIKHPRQLSAPEIVKGLRQLVAAAHRHGVRAVGATLMPFGGHRQHSPQLEAVRQQVNELIRNGKVFDAVIDFDVALRDPAHPDRLRPAFDSGDHLHPSDNGYRAMAQAVDLNVLRGKTPTAL